MVHRYVPLASFLGGVLFSGCVIYTEPGAGRGGPPPPPPPPAKANRAQPGAKPAGKPGQVTFKPNTGQPQPQPQTETQGDINVAVLGGSCTISVDGVGYGHTNQASIKAGPGAHEVSCLPTSGNIQKQNVTVKTGEAVAVSFNLQNPTKSTNVSTPIGIAPPVGRPTVPPK